MPHPDITIKYFDIRGRAEPLRLCLHLGGIPFKDVRLTPSTFTKLKTAGELPFNQLPIMILNGETVTQSQGLARYCGKLSGLYPKDDDVKALRVDEMLGAVNDLMGAMFKYRGDDVERQKEERKVFVEVEVPRFCEGVKRIWGKRIWGKEERKYLCGENVTVPDLGLWYAMWNVKKGNVDFVDKEVFGKYDWIEKVYKNVSEHPKVVEWNKKMETKK